MILLIAFSFSPACSGPDQVDLMLTENGTKLHRRGQNFYCQLQALGRKSQTLWDEVATDLEKGIPEDLPEDERKNMIAIRNAGLIRMFEAYPKLPMEVKERVDRAETEDQQIAAEMRMLNDSLRLFDRRVEQFLEEVKNLQPDSLESWQKRLIVYNCED